MKYRLVLIATLLLALNGCYGCPPAILPPECREFFDLPAKERELKFQAYPVGKQVDIYLCGMKREPPHIGYASYIAEGGEKNVPYLLERLKAEQSEITRTNLIGIFRSLSIQGHLRGRSDVLAQLEQVVSEMKSEPARWEAQEHLQVIRRGSE